MTVQTERLVSSNFHTHTVFCDGDSTPRELVEEALSLGCPAIGFSGHSYTAFDTEGCMSPEGTHEYVRQIRALQELYRGKIRIFCGIEQDYFSEEPTDTFDYRIGSVHYICKDGCYLPVDISAEDQRRDVAVHYGGDFYAYIEDYYRLVADVYRKTHCTIVGHFDLVTKYNEQEHLFDTSHPRYIAAADAALDTLLQTPVAFEINTGAVLRGYRATPYPEARILERIRKAGRKILWTSDCHTRRNLLYGIPAGEPAFM